MTISGENKMKKIIFGFVVGLILGVVGGAYAMAPTPWCYFSAPNVCTDVTIATPMPIMSN